MRTGLLFLVSTLAACPSGDACDGDGRGLVCRVAGTSAMGFNGDGKPAEDTDLYLVSRARRGPDGRIYLMDFNNHRLRVIGEDGLVATVAGNGFHAFALAGEPAVESPLENPDGFDFLPDGRVVFVSLHDPRVLTIDADGLLRVLAGTGDLGEVGDEGDGGPAELARFIELADVAAGADGTLYVADDKANRVRVIRDGIVETLVADLDFPTALEVDPAGNLLVADSLDHRVLRVAPDGTKTVIAGTGEAGFGGDGGPATEALLSGPNGLALGDDGTLYLSDRQNFRVRRVAPNGIIQTLAGTGARGLAGDDGPALDAEFGYLAGLSLDGDRLLVADQTNSCVREIRF